MFNILQTVFKALALIAAVIGIVERPGDGEQKKKEAMEIIREKLPELIVLPQWARELFLESAFLGWIIDLAVWAANKYGFFVSSSGGETSSTTA